MAIFYLDNVNGNDSNDGSDWAHAWLTAGNGATAARIAPGDEIRVAKTPDPVSSGINATFTNGSADVTLDSAITAQIWQAITTSGVTSSTNVSTTTNSSRKFGGACVQSSILAAFTTGKVLYSLVDGGGTADYSAYSKITLWIKVSAAVADSVISIKLCSDTGGNTPVATFNIPAISLTNQFIALTLDNGGALPSNVQSIAVYANSDPGAVTLYFNNVQACNDISLSTLIGKSGDVNYQIQSINGTTLRIDNGTTQNLSGRGYYGTTENVALYYDNAFLAPIQNANFFIIQDAGTITAGRISFIGGWDTGTNTRTGRTVYINPARCSNTALSGSNKSFIALSYFTVAGWVTAFDSSPGCLYDNIIAIGMNAVLSSTQDVTFNNCKFLNSGSAPSFNNAQGYSFYNCWFVNSLSYCMQIEYGMLCTNCVFANSGNGVNVLGGDNRSQVLMFRNCLFDLSAEFATMHAGWWWSYDHDQTPGNYIGASFGGVTADRQSSVVHGSEPWAWRIGQSWTNRRDFCRSVLFPIAEIAVKPDLAVTITAWVKKSVADAALTVELLVEDAPFSLPGITETVDQKTNDTNWEQLTVTVTPTSGGVLQAWIRAYATTSSPSVQYIYIGAISFNQA